MKTALQSISDRRESEWDVLANGHYYRSTESEVMRYLTNAFIMFMLVAPSGSQAALPKAILGTWRIGPPSDTPLPVGLTAKEEKYIRSLRLHYSAETLNVCGKSIPVRPVKIQDLRNDDFLQEYGFLPEVIGLEGASISDVSIHADDMMNACGEYESPGVHLLLGQNGHIVMEVANDYFPLERE